PEVETHEDAEDGTTEEDIVQVRDHEVGIRDLVVEGHNRQGRSIQATNQEQGDEATGKEHWNLDAHLAKGDGRDPVEDLHSGRNGDQRGAGSEKGLRDRRKANSEHVVRPYSEAQETDSYTRPGDKGIAENRFTREDRQYLGDHTKGRQD